MSDTGRDQALAGAVAHIHDELADVERRSAAAYDRIRALEDEISKLDDRRGDLNEALDALRRVSGAD